MLRAKLLTACMLIVLLSPAILQADTIPGGDVSGAWYQSHSPYYINGHITVQMNDTLNIETGVDVIFLGYYRFGISGVLEAVGSVSDSVHFLPQDTLTGWQGLYFSGQKICHLYYCDIRYAYSGIRLATAKNVYISHCTVAHCRSSNYGGGIFVDLQANLRLSNSIIEQNTAEANTGGKGGGICVWNSDSTFVDSCTIRGNRALIPIYTTNYPYDSLPEGGGIFTRKGIGVHAFITNCVITGNYAMLSNGNFAGLARGGGIYIGSTQTVISGCVVRDNVVKSNNFGVSNEWMDGSGIYLDGYSSNTQVTHCDISRNIASAGGALNVRTNNVTISNCTFFGNTAAYGGPGLSGHAILVNYSFGTGMDIANCILAYNTSGILGQSTACRYSNIYQNDCENMASGFGVLDTVNYNGDSCDVYNNIFLDPMFVDTANLDLHLTAGSPCIDAGDPASPLDPDGTIADLGCYYYDHRLPHIELSNSLLDFDTVMVGEQGDLPLAIHNVGTIDTLVLYDISCGLAVFSTDFDPLDSLILPSDSLQITVSFSPSDTTTALDTLQITNNDHLCEVKLMGKGKKSNWVSEEVSPELPKEYALRPAYPNPFNPITTIGFDLPKPSEVTLRIYNILGQEVGTFALGRLSAGKYGYVWQADGLASGVYFYRIEAGEFIQTKKIVMMK